MLRAGIAGAGFMGRVHAHAVRAAGGRVTRVAASTPERSAEAAAALGADASAATAVELASSPDVDVVHVCTPNALHAEVALAALAAGKPVVCEKPLATTVAGAARLTEAAAGQVATVPFVYRFYPSVREARARIAAGEAGPLHLLHGTYLQDWLSRPDDTNWRTDPAQGGASRAFADIGVHWCDLMEFVTGHRITALSARTLTVFGGARAATEDAATVMFTTDQGAAGSVVVSQVSPGRRNRLWFSFDGADASYSFDQEQPGGLWAGGRDHNRLLPPGAGSMTGAAAPYAVLPPGHPQGYQDCFDAFVRDTYAAVAGGEPDGLPRFADGLRAAVLTDAVLASAAAGAWVPVA
jgi:predicted dehydrogenase